MRSVNFDTCKELLELSGVKHDLDSDFDGIEFIKISVGSPVFYKGEQRKDLILLREDSTAETEDFIKIVRKLI